LSTPDRLPTWLTVFVDLPPAEFDAGSAFWSATTGYQLSAFRGEAGEFATLLPPSGDAYLRVQRLADGLTRLHLDVHVDDPWVEARRAVELGAEVVDDQRHGYVVVRSPSGFVFCLVPSFGSVVPPARTWPSGQHSRVAQLCVDIPQADYAEELAFWQALTGGEWKTRSGEDPLATRMAGGLALELRVQPSMFADQPSGHLHLATDDRGAEVQRLVGLGAVKRVDRGSWTLLEAVGGLPLCVVDDPDGGDCPV
jgi:hypothetical protein